MAFFDDLFDSITNQQATPQRTITSTADNLNQAYATAQGQIPNFTAYNQALQPVMTGLQLSNQNQIFGPAANQVQTGVYQSILDNLNLGNSVPAELQDLITQNTLQGLSSSGVGGADAGKLFGARSLLSAGLDLGASRRNEALGAALQLPSSRYQYQPEGMAGIDVGGIANDLRSVTAAQDELANITENIRRENFSSLINTGGRIVGTAAGAYFGAMAGNPIGGAQAGGAVGGSLLGKTGVSGYGAQGASGGGIGGGGGSSWASILQGLGGGTQGGMYSAGYGDRPASVTAGRVGMFG